MRQMRTSGSVRGAPGTGVPTAIAGYNYYGVPTLFSLIAHPELGGYFIDDEKPGSLDPIAGYGTMGFNEPGQVACSGGEGCACCFPDGICQVMEGGECSWKGGMCNGCTCDPYPCLPGLGACCFCQVCTVTTLQSCEVEGGVFLGYGTGCSPAPCLPPPGACCYPDGRCEFVPECVCHAGNWVQGPCDPNPCVPTAARITTWGEIKSRYH